ncbi:DUF4943 family protein [Sunxiuqinia sp. A32]|uniref:DUF4943 family protein n=1 Tax=Sunxiuqinia sp. A32 TaxID=3461496 RepID=UPI00404658CC
MKMLFVAIVLIFSCVSCEKEDFDINKPDVGKFVQQIKNGTYDNYYVNENGEKLWLLMPEFNEEHIQLLIEFSSDTTHIHAYPLNSLSSRTPYPIGRDYAILGECLLWSVEGIRNQMGYGSLDPYLIDDARDESERYKGINGNEVLQVRELYKDWWDEYQTSNWREINPLEGTTYRWF